MTTAIVTFIIAILGVVAVAVKVRRNKRGQWSLKAGARTRRKQS